MNYALFGGLDEDILALPFYEEQHRTFAVELADWCAGHAGLWSRPLEQTPEKAGREILSALGSAGWLGFLDPANGSAAGDQRSICLAREILAYADDLADFAFSIQALSATPIVQYGNSEQQLEYLPRMASGELTGSFAISEEEAGSDISAVGLTADRVSDGYLLNGRKAWIANAGIADVHCVIARTGGGPGALGLTAFLVPARTPGVRVLEEVRLVAPRSFGHLVFEDCLVPESSVLGRPGQGFVVATDLLERFRMTVGAAAVGFARRALDSAVQRARERRIHGGRLMDLQLVKGALADMEIKLNSSAMLVARAAWEARPRKPRLREALKHRQGGRHRGRTGDRRRCRPGPRGSRPGCRQRPRALVPAGQVPAYLRGSVRGPEADHRGRAGTTAARGPIPSSIRTRCNSSGALTCRPRS